MSLPRWFFPLLLLGNTSATAGELYHITTTTTQPGVTQVAVEPTPGTHVNTDAPLWMKVEEGDPLKGTGEGHHAIWQVATPRQEGIRIQLQFSLCDDALTWCKPINTQFTYRNGAEQVSEGVSSPPLHRGEGHPGAIPGAIQDDLDQALSRAQNQGSLVFIDFHGIWCPPCQMLASEGMNDPRVQEVVKSMVLVQLDADKESSWSAKSRYQVRGYPTIILARADGTEISRMEGYPGAAAFATWLDTSRRSGRSLHEWTTLRNGGDRSPEVLLGLARGLSSMELLPEAAAAYGEALPSLSGADATEAHLALLEQAARSGDKKQVKAHVRALTGVSPMTDVVPVGLYVVAGSSADEGLSRYLLQKALDTSDLALAGGQVKGMELASLYEIRAAALEGLERPEEARAEYSLACDTWISLEKALPGSGPERYATFRGQARSLTDDLHAAGRDAEADALHQRLVAAFPNEFTYYYDYAAFLKDTGKLGEAQLQAEKAVNLSYGDNHLRSVGRLADILITAGKSEEALQLLEQTITTQPLPADPGVRTTRYVDQLRKKLDTLEKAKAAAQNPSGTPANG